jgi:hypothetical protein
MRLSDTAKPALDVPTNGLQGNATLGSSQNSDTANPQPIQETNLATQAAKAALIRELFGEALAIGIDCAAKSLRHVLADDDNEAIVACQGFLVAAHTAAECARKLRDTVEASGQ